MLRNAVIGAIAGALATGPQSAVVWGFRSAGVYRRQPPPEVIAEQANEPAIDAGVLSPSLRRPAMVADHVGFGAAGGALFGLIAGVVPPTPLLGVLTGLAIWKISYDGWIPALRIMPPPEKDERGRQVTMVAAHIAYGLSLAATFRRLAR